MGKTEIMMSMIKGRSFQVPAVMISLASEQDFIANVNLKNKTVTYFTSEMGFFSNSRDSLASNLWQNHWRVRRRKERNALL